jgi:hypothetical protein
MNDTSLRIPSSTDIRTRMQACREELTSLKRLLRAAEAAERAEQARRARQPSGRPADKEGRRDE